MPSDVLSLSPRITGLPVIHGSGYFALWVRRLMLEQTFDCLAVPLPPSFQADVERGIELLPSPTTVTQSETPQFEAEWSSEQEAPDDDTEFESADEEDEPTHSYVPIDPCQPVIA